MSMLPQSFYRCTTLATMAVVHYKSSLLYCTGKQESNDELLSSLRGNSFANVLAAQKDCAQL
jgi:hypothetical protein